MATSEPVNDSMFRHRLLIATTDADLPGINSVSIVVVTDSSRKLVTPRKKGGTSSINNVSKGLKPDGHLNSQLLARIACNGLPSHTISRLLDNLELHTRHSPACGLREGR